MSTECKRCGECCYDFVVPLLENMHEPPLWVAAMLTAMRASDVALVDASCIFLQPASSSPPVLAGCVIHDKPWRPDICQRFSCEGRCDGMDSREEDEK